MSVLVVNDGIRMFARRVEPHRNVVLVWGAQEKPSDFQLPLTQVGFRFEHSKVFLILDGQHNNRRGGINRRSGESLMKYPPHTLELVGDVASLLFAGITQYDEMRAADFEPILRLVSRQCEQSSE